MIARFYIGLVSLSCVATVSAMHTPDYEAIHNLKRSGTMLAPIHVQKNWGTPLSHSAPIPSYVPKSYKAPSPKSKSVATGELESASAILRAQVEAKEKKDAETLKKLLEADRAKACAALLQVASQTKVSVQVSIGDTTFQTAFALTPLNHDKDKTEKKS